MLKAKIIDREWIYGGKHYFENGEIVDVVLLRHDGECQICEVLKEGKEQTYNIYESEFQALEFFEG